MRQSVVRLAVKVLKAHVVDGSRFVGVRGRRGGNVLVHGRRLVIPADAETGALGEHHVVVHPQDASGARLRREVGLADGRPLLGDDHLDHECVGDFGAVARLHVAGVSRAVAMLAGDDAVVELELDVAVGAGVIRLPAVVHVLLAEYAGLGAGHALLLRLCVVGGVTGDRGVLLAGGGHGLDGLLQLPRNLLELPELDRLVGGVCAGEAVEAERDVVGAGRVDHLVVVGAGLDVGGGEDADRVVRELRLREGALDVKVLLELDGRLRAGSALDEGGLGLELVGDGGDGRVHGRGEVTLEENREGKLVNTLLKRRGVREERPALQLGVLVGALAAVVGEGALLLDVDIELGAKGLDLQLLVLDFELHLARDEGASRGLCIAKENDGRALDLQVEACMRVVVRVLVGAAKRQREAVVVVLLLLEVVCGICCEHVVVRDVLAVIGGVGGVAVERDSSQQAFVLDVVVTGLVMLLVLLGLRLEVCNGRNTEVLSGIPQEVCYAVGHDWVRLCGAFPGFRGLAESWNVRLRPSSLLL